MGTKCATVEFFLAALERVSVYFTVAVIIIRPFKSPWCTGREPVSSAGLAYTTVCFSSKSAGSRVGASQKITVSQAIAVVALSVH